VREAALSVSDLVKVYRSRKQPAATAGVRGVSFDVGRSEVVGLIGESGCGKSTLARCVTRLTDPDSGRILVEGQDFGAMSGGELRGFRRRIQIVFQRPETSLNPRMTVHQFVREAMRSFGTAPAGAERDRALELASLVGLREDAVDAYPHQLSGGEKQRVGIMRALACDPSVIVLDEPTSALDVSVQAQVLRTLRDLQARMGMALLFISHDVAVIRYMCSRVLVMYLGLVVEEGPTDQVLSAPRHPYTRALLSAVPRLSPSTELPFALTGELHAPTADTQGCPLRPRCPLAFDRCCEEPPLADIGGGARARCWLVQ
jgi:oligopeptide/dipeptide ABC transporter ATP-binding protein